MSGTVGRQLLSSVVYTGDIQQYLSLALEAYLFKESELPLYDYISKHLLTYGTIPAQTTIESIPEFETALVEAPEPPKFYLDQVEKRHLHTSLKAAVNEINVLLTSKNADEALDALLKTSVSLFMKRGRKQIFDIRDAQELIQQTYMEQKKLGSDIVLPFGWKTLDDMTGGMRPGDFNTVVGRPACLSGDTLIWVSRKKASSGRFYSLRDLYHRFHGGAIPSGANGSLIRFWNQSIATKVNSRGEDGLTVLNVVNDVVFSGKKTTYTVTTIDGKVLRATAEHKFLTETGYLQLSALKPGDKVICRVEREGQGEAYVKPRKELTSKLPYSPYRTRVVAGIVYHRVKLHRLAFDAALNGLSVIDFVSKLKSEPNHGLVFSDPEKHIHHRDGDTENNDPGNLELLSNSEHMTKHSYEVNTRTYFRKYETAPVTIKSIELYGEEDTYDICMNYPLNNFIAHGFVVHNSGKTMLGLYNAIHAWKAGRVPLFVSMEMLRTVIVQRLSAMLTKKKLTNLIKAEMSTFAFNEMMHQLYELKECKYPFWVADGSMTSTVDDILLTCRQLKPSCVYVDGAYLLGHENSKMGKWDKQAENARLLKQRLATDLGIPVLASYQLSKESAKLKAKSGVKGGKGKEHKDDMSDVHGSDEMAQLSTVMLGSFDDDSAVESKIRRRIKILKGRNGEDGAFTINWDFSKEMDFSEYNPEKPEDVQFEYMG